MYMEHKFVVDGRQTVQTAVKILEGALNLDVRPLKRSHRLSNPRSSRASIVSHAGASVMLSQLDINRKPKRMLIRQGYQNHTPKIVAASGSAKDLKPETIYIGDFELGTDVQNNEVPPQTSPSAFAPKVPSHIDNVEISHPHHAKLLSQALQLVFASEVLVFAEYAEFACSLVYGFYTIVLYQLPYAKYNFFFVRLPENQFYASVVNSFAFAALEGLSMVLFYLVVRGKYGISTFHQLAFVLEKYWMTVHGKLTGSLSLLFILSTIHRGTDLTLTFNWAQLPSNLKCSHVSPLQK